MKKLSIQKYISIKQVILTLITSLILGISITLHQMFYYMNIRKIIFQLSSPSNSVDASVIGFYALAIMITSFGCFIILILLLVAIKILVHKSRIINIINYVIWCISVLQTLVWLEVPQYIITSIHNSTIYENNYINPKDIEITGDNTNNLIIIYLESMESTYTDIKHGGATDINYIPNLTNLAEQNISFSYCNSIVGGGFGCSWN